MISADNRFGPWAAEIDEPERRARLRSLRAIVRLSTGRRGDALSELLRRAEHEPSALEAALTALSSLAPLDRRQVLGSYAHLHRHA